MNTRFSTSFRFLSILCLAWAGASGFGQAPIISSFSQNGELVCTNLEPGTFASIEWASSLNGPWVNTWSGLEFISVDSNGMIRVSVPMFYRVRKAPPHPGMVLIPAGSFTMGSPSNEVGRNSDESPQTQVTISRGFYMGIYEVTQGEYASVTGTNPSYFGGNLSLPVEQVSWFDATNYCGLLTMREQQKGRLTAGWIYRLPTEAEWEYACRAGTITRFSWGDDPGYVSVSNYVWGLTNSGGTTHPVGQKLANPWGLYDMGGDVWNWCQDWYAAYYGGQVTDPQGPSTGSFRVLRGGSWHSENDRFRSAYRMGVYTPSFRDSRVGFRVVLALGQ